MRPVLPLLLLLVVAAPAAAQTTRDTSITEVFYVVEQMPELIGGLASIQPVYPDAERAAGIEGRVFVHFVVAAGGSVARVTVAQGLSPGLDAAAVAAVRTARFRPGFQRGRPVAVRFSLPITFRLRNDPQMYAAVDLRLRDRPGGRRGARLPPGTALGVQECSDGWCRVAPLGGPVGYVRRSDLRRTQPPVPATPR